MINDYMGRPSGKTLIELAKLSSAVHTEPHYGEYKYFGKTYECMGLSVPKDVREYPGTEFHVVLIKPSAGATEHQLRRIFVYDSMYTNTPFQLYNVNNDDTLTRVDISQPCLFSMFEYLMYKHYKRLRRKIKS